MDNVRAIETHQLTRCYGDSAAVADLDLVVTEGAISCLLGPNGSGKTTTVAMLTTSLRPTSGTATICGHDIRREANRIRSIIGVTLQHTGVDDLMTGREMLLLQATLHGLGRTARNQRAAELVDLLDLGSHIDTRMETWSGGLRRRMNLAAALVHRPRVLFLDEPTTGLDPASRRALWEEIRRLNREDGVTVFLTTQYLEEADYLADEVSILRDGRLLISATPAELKDGLGERTLLVGLIDAESAVRARELVGGHVDEERPHGLRLVVAADGAPRHLAELTHAGIEVESLTISEPSLEDVFLRLTSVSSKGAS